MSELPSYGTGWSESEVLMDVVTIYNTWNGEGEVNVDSVRRRLREKFTDTELIALDAVVEMLGRLIDVELTSRSLPT